MSPATEDCVVAAKHAESKRSYPLRAGREIALPSADDLVADLGMTASNHSDVLGCRFGEVEDASSDEGATVVDPDHDAPTIVCVGHLQLGAEPERLVGRGEERRIHPFTRSSARVKGIP